METVWTFEKFVPYHSTTGFHNPEELNLNLHYHENLKSHIKTTVNTDWGLFGVYCILEDGQTPTLRWMAAVPNGISTWSLLVHREGVSCRYLYMR